jgi:hypothetical protein
MKMTKLATLVLSASLAVSGAAFAAGADAASAAQSRDLDALKTLLKQRVDVNAAQADGTTALMWAAHYNDAEAVNLLLKAGANAKAANRYGTTALSEAVASGSAATIEALLNAGADAKTVTSQAGETVLMTAARTGNVDAVKTSGGSEARRFLGSDLELGKRLGLSADWTQRVIKQVGNYGEMFEASIGATSPLGMNRGINALCAGCGRPADSAGVALSLP